ncbi:MAG TPA: hypothetical protein PLV97_10950, partial [Chitinophagales bacterium]|nr:hypothetical protein [Chitinophagales bacterium]
VGIGYGIKLASDGLANLVQSFNQISNAGYALGGVVAVMGGFVGMLGVMIPVIGALGGTATAVWPGLLALGAAFVGIGYGIKLASDGLANLVSSFAGLKDGSSAMWSVVAVMGGFVAISAILIPELAALGTSLAVFGTLGWIAVPPLLALGAAGIALGYGIKLAGEGISYVVKSFSEFTASILKTTDSAPKLLALGGALAMISPSLILFGAASILAAPGILAMSIALGLLAPSIGIIIPSLEKLSSINSGNITNISKSFGDLSLGLLSLSGIGVLFPLLALASGAISLLVPALSNLVPTINELSKVDTNVLSNVASSLKSIVPSLFLFSTIGVLSPLLMGASIALGVLGKSLTYFSGLKISNLSNTIDEVSNSAGSLAKLSLIGLLSAPLALASATLMLLGPAISSLSNSISQISKLDWNSLKGVGQGLDAVIPALNKFSIFGFLAAPIMLGAASLVVLGKSMLSAASGFLEMSKIDWSSMDKIGNVLNNLLPSLSGFGLKGFAAAPGIYLMNSTIGSLATTMERLANPLDLATKSLGNMSDNIVRLKSAIQGLDTSKLNNLAAISDKFVGSTVQTAVVSKSEPSPQVAQKIKIDPIHINLKLNGKDVQEIIVKDTAYHI